MISEKLLPVPPTSTSSGLGLGWRVLSSLPILGSRALNRVLLRCGCLRFIFKSDRQISANRSFGWTLTVDTHISPWQTVYRLACIRFVGLFLLLLYSLILSLSVQCGLPWASLSLPGNIAHSVVRTMIIWYWGHVRARGVGFRGK